MILRQLKRILLVVVVAVIFIGCATMFSGTTKNVFIDTDDKKERTVRLEKEQTSFKKDIYIYNWIGENLIIPKTVSLQRGEKYRICSVGQDNSTCLRIDRTFNPAFLANLLFGGIIGMIVDGATGAVFSFDDTYVYALTIKDIKSTNHKEEVKHESKKEVKYGSKK